MSWVTLGLTLAATASTGLIAGASLDQSIKQLPARHRMGVVAFSAYSRAADLGNGILFYAILGAGSALLCLAAASAVWLQPTPGSLRLPLTLAAGLALLHSGATAKAAPTNFSQRNAGDDAVKLAKIFDRFTFWQSIRAPLQVITFGVLLWGLVAAR